MKLLIYIKEWNTNAKYAYVCHCVLDCIISNIHLSKYLVLDNNTSNTTNNTPNTSNTTVKYEINPIKIQIKNHIETSLAGLSIYSERHYQRLSKLNQSSYIIDYICNSMHLLTENNDGNNNNNTSTNGSDNNTSSSIDIGSGSGHIAKKQRVGVGLGLGGMDDSQLDVDVEQPLHIF